MLSVYINSRILTVYLLKHTRQLELRAHSKLILMIIGESLKGKALAYFK